MNQAIITRAPMAPVQMPMHATRTRIRRTEVPEPTVRFPSRGTTGPVHISTLLNPILEICRNPDRDRLLAKLFSEM